MQHLLFKSPTLWSCYGGLSSLMLIDLPHILTREVGMIVHVQHELEEQGGLEEGQHPSSQGVIKSFLRAVSH